MSRVVQVFNGQIIFPYHPGNNVITTLSHRRNHRILQNCMETKMKPNLRYVDPFVIFRKKKTLFPNNFAIDSNIMHLLTSLIIPA